MPSKIYLLDDDPPQTKLLKSHLSRSGEFKVRTFQYPVECLEAIAEEPPDALLTDLKMPEMDGTQVARNARELSPHLPIYVLTAHADIETAVEAMKAGADEYLQKPVNVTALTTLLRKALSTRPLIEEASSMRKASQQRYGVSALLGRHALMQGVRDFVDVVAQSPNVSVLLLGESGVGKNLAARVIHHASPTVKGQFVELNCAALPESLLEAELFGYMRGAFTDAKESKPGLVEVADGGTLFLDEIAELPLALQVKLLNFLESRRFRRLGGTRELEVNLRVITATNRPLTELVAQRAFRQDLFYRISVASHTLPPLRKIASDIPVLAESIVMDLAVELGKDVKGLTPQALDALCEWRWPGNVRELRNALERAMLFARGDRLDVTDLPPLEASHSRPPAVYPMPRDLTLKGAEREYIRMALEAHGNSVAEAAESLGISRKNLWEKRKRHGLLA